MLDLAIYVQMKIINYYYISVNNLERKHFYFSSFCRKVNSTILQFQRLVFYINNYIAQIGYIFQIYKRQFSLNKKE